MRVASASDLDAVVDCIVSLTNFVKSAGSDPYIDGLPDAATDQTREYAARFLQSPNAFALLEERDGDVIGCLAGCIEPTSFPPGGVGTVGRIDVCWVHEDQRGAGVASSLVAAAEQRFRDAGVSIVELSYLAGNSIAASAWPRLGFRPFRVYSYKRIGSDS